MTKGGARGQIKDILKDVFDLTPSPILGHKPKDSLKSALNRYCSIIAKKKQQKIFFFLLFFMFVQQVLYLAVFISVTLEFSVHK